MRELDLDVPAGTDTAGIEAAVERVCAALSLSVTMKSSLASFRGSIHWHVKKGSQKGTLELTSWPGKRPLWVQIQSGRTAPWIDETLPAFRRQLAQEFKP